MSGHSKWSQIKRKKGAKDVQKGKIFSKLTRLITVSVLEGGGVADPQLNVRLRMAIEKAKEENMPKENIKRAIEKAQGEEKEQIREMMYEGFGPKRTVFLIQATTDNSNRTHSEIKAVLERQGGKIGDRGSVMYQFKKCASIIFDKKETPEEKVFSFAEGVQAFDIEEDETSCTVYFPFENVGRAPSGEVDYKPLTLVKIENAADAKKITTIMESLEALDDVQKVFSNFDIPEKFLI